MPDAAPTPPPPPALSLEAFTTAIGDVTRWRILAELSKGEPLMALELAQRTGRTETVISKQMAVLRKAGAAVSGRGRLYQIPTHFRIGVGVVDFGYGPLRMAAPQQ